MEKNTKRKYKIISVVEVRPARSFSKTQLGALANNA